MPSRGTNGVGRFSVDIEIGNNDDLALVRRGRLRPEQVRRRTIPGVVDSGAAMLVLPQAIAKELGLPMEGKVKVRYADGRQAERWEAKAVFVKLLGRDVTLPAIVEPKRETALIGAMVLQALDLLVDCQHQRLIPRDPEGAVYEIE